VSLCVFRAPLQLDGKQFRIVETIKYSDRISREAAFVLDAFSDGESPMALSSICFWVMVMDANAALL
jgi:hypothetical protein